MMAIRDEKRTEDDPSEGTGFEPVHGVAPALNTLSYFEIVFAVLEHFWWRKRCQKRGGKWNCNRRREAIIGSQVQEIMPKGA